MWFVISKPILLFVIWITLDGIPNQDLWQDVTIWKILYVFVVVVIALCY